MSPRSTICIVHPNPGSKCETFIRAHIERLRGVGEILHGGHMPLFNSNCQRLHSTLPQTPALLFSPDGPAIDDLQEKAITNMVDFLRRQKVDVVLAEYGPTGIAMNAPCRRAGIPLVVHFHGYDVAMTAVLEKYRLGYSWLFAEVAAVVAVSREMKNDLLRLGAPEKRLHYNPCGVDTMMFQSVDPAANPPRFVSVGRFVDKKAPEATLAAFTRVLPKVPEAELVMVGDGILLDSSRRLSRCLGISERVTFSGRLAHRDVALTMRGARCFVQHSVTAASGDKEGTPISVLEAGASALPVIATRHGGIADSVVHGETGLLCDEMDIETMACHMLDVARDSKLAARMGMAARERVCRLYDIHGRMAALQTILKDAVDGKGQG